MAVFIVSPNGNAGSSVRRVSLQRDRDGNRDYKVSYLVCCNQQDGPGNCLLASGLPRPGDPYILDNDRDDWAFCKLDVAAKQLLAPPEDVNKFYELEFTFSTKSDEKRCKDQPIDDPLLIPDRISGSFSKYTEEQSWDRFGNLLTNSAWELIKGPQVEMDMNRPTVKIEKNTATLDLGILYACSNCVNAFPMWGFGARMIKLSNISWERKFYANCYEYFTWGLDFDVNPMTHDRNILDVGTKALYGAWDRDTGVYQVKNVAAGVPANKLNPMHFIRFKDKNGENCQTLLDGNGLPATTLLTTAKPWSSTVRYAAGDRATYLGRVWAATLAGAAAFGGLIGIKPGNNVPAGQGGGGPAWTAVAFTTSRQPANRFVEFYPGVDFTILGVPLTF